MSYMSPSYLVQSQFNTSWTPSPNGTLFCSIVRSGGRINRCVLLRFLSLYLYKPSSIRESQSFSFLAMLGLPTRSIQ